MKQCILTFLATAHVRKNHTTRISLSYKRSNSKSKLVFNHFCGTFEYVL